MTPKVVTVQRIRIRDIAARRGRPSLSETRESVSDDAAVVADIAERVRHLFPLTRDPERFHIERDGIIRDLVKLERRLRGGPSRERIHVWRPE